MRSPRGRYWGLTSFDPSHRGDVSLRSRLALLAGGFAFTLASGFAFRLTFGLGFSGRFGFADCRDDPHLELAFDFLTEVHVHGVQAKFLERALEPHLVGRDCDFVLLERS